MRGYSLISFLIGTALSALLLTLIAKDAHHLFSMQTHIIQRAKISDQEIKIRELTDTFSRDSDTHRLDIPPRIHRNGQVLFANNEMNQLSQSTSPNAPDSSSDAMTNFSLSSMEYLKVLEVKRTALSFQYIACAAFQVPQPNDDEQSFIAISADGPSYLFGTIRKIRNRKGCFLLNLRQQVNMLLPIKENLIPLGVRSLIPIDREYTIYLSKKGELRYLGHKARKNVENQPLFGPLLQIHFTLSIRSPENLLLFGTQVLFSNEYGFSYASAAHLSRFSHLNLLLNQI